MEECLSKLQLLDYNKSTFVSISVINSIHRRMKITYCEMEQGLVGTDGTSHGHAPPNFVSRITAEGIWYNGMALVNTLSTENNLQRRHDYLIIGMICEIHHQAIDFFYPLSNIKFGPVKESRPSAITVL